MAKSKAPSKRSRAIRRATSPSIDTDKSLKEIQPPRRSSINSRPAVLAVHQSAGVTKKSKHGRKSQMSAKARRRHEKGLEMAEAVGERTSKKVAKSLDRARSIQERSKAWEDINRAAGAAEEAAKAAVGEAGEEKEWETDEEMDVPDAKETTAVENAAVEEAAAPAADDDEDVIL